MMETKLRPNEDGVLQCKCGAYPILVEAEAIGGEPPVGYVCLKCPACMKPRRGSKGKSAELIALEAWNTATINEHLVAGEIGEAEARRAAQVVACTAGKILSAAEAEEIASKRRLSGFSEWGARKAVEHGD